MNISCLYTYAINTIRFINKFLCTQCIHICGDNFIGSVTFAPGVIQFEIEIDIRQDRVLEGDEQFFVIATPRAQPPGSRNATAAVTIKDDDGMFLNFLRNFKKINYFSIYCKVAFTCIYY